MTACPDQIMLLHGLLDNELDAANTLACEAHLKSCAACNDEFLRLLAIRDAVTAPGLAYRAPDSLRLNIEAALEEATAPPLAARRTFRRIPPWAASGSLAALAACLALVVAIPHFTESDVQNQVIASHVRSLLANHLTDVATSNQHVVRPWFNGRIDFSPPVPDLVSQGFPLAGGRLDYVNGRVIPAIVYHRRLHTINLFAWPASHEAIQQATTRHDGYSLVKWTQGGLEYWAVSDIDPKELELFQQEFVASTR